MPLVLYHNPRCSKSRQALALLEQRGLSPQIVKYLQTPPSADEVRSLLVKLGEKPSALLRKKEAPYAELGLDDDSDADRVAEAIAAHPVLLERPVLVHGERAVIGRPPENVLEIL